MQLLGSQNDMATIRLMRFVVRLLAGTECPPIFQGPSGRHPLRPYERRHSSCRASVSPDRPIPQKSCRESEKITLPGLPAGVMGFPRERRHLDPSSSEGILTFFPFAIASRLKHLMIRLRYDLGSTNPCAIAVHMEPYSTSVFKDLT